MNNLTPREQLIREILDLDDEDVKAVLAYIQSLRARCNCPTSFNPIAVLC